MEEPFKYKNWEFYVGPNFWPSKMEWVINVLFFEYKTHILVFKLFALTENKNRLITRLLDEKHPHKEIVYSNFLFIYAKNLRPDQYWKIHWSHPYWPFHGLEWGSEPINSAEVWRVVVHVLTSITSIYCYPTILYWVFTLFALFLLFDYEHYKYWDLYLWYAFMLAPAMYIKYHYFLVSVVSTIVLRFICWNNLTTYLWILYGRPYWIIIRLIFNILLKWNKDDRKTLFQAVHSGNAPLTYLKSAVLVIASHTPLIWFNEAKKHVLKAHNFDFYKDYPNYFVQHYYLSWVNIHSNTSIAYSTIDRLNTYKNK